MNIYNFDRDTKEFTGASVAAQDPLDQDGWLVPAYATTIAPVSEAGYAPVFNGTAWDQVEDHRGQVWYSVADQSSIRITLLGPIGPGYTDKVPPSVCHEFDSLLGDWVLNTAKAQKKIWDKIKLFRDDRNQNGGFKVGNLWFHSDTFSRSQYIGLVIMGESIPEGIQWKTMSGEFIMMTPALALQVFQAATVSDVTVFGAAEAHRIALEASEDPLNYDYSSGWPEIYVGE